MSHTVLVKVMVGPTASLCKVKLLAPESLMEKFSVKTDILCRKCE